MCIRRAKVSFPSAKGLSSFQNSHAARSRLMKRLITSRLLGTAFAVFMLAQSASDAFACPNCKEAVSASTSEMANTSSGYNWSVLFMLAVPFSLFGTGAFMIRRATRKGTLPEW
jgi:hypothetical protein